MDRSLRDKDGTESPILKRAGIHDERSSDMFFLEENNYRFGNAEHSTSPSRRKNGIVFKQLFCRHLFAIVTVLVIILGVGVELQFPPLLTEERGYRQFNASLKNLQEAFPNQTEQLWSVSLASAKPVLLQKLPKHPAVIFLAGSRKSEAVTNCLARKMSELLNDAFDTQIPISVLDCTLYKGWNVDKVKQDITEKLTVMFGNGSKVAVVFSVESLDGDLQTIFDRFFDETNAPFKKAAIILTMNMKEELALEEDKEKLNELRGPDAEKDKEKMLLSHFKKSVAFVRDEVRCICKR